MRLLFVTLLCMLAASCQKDTADQCDTLTDCTGDCLYVLENKEAVTYYLGCFDRWGMVYVNDDGSWVGLIPDQINSSYETDSIRVSVCGYARENTLPLVLADPNFNAVYQVSLEHIETID